MARDNQNNGNYNLLLTVLAGTVVGAVAASLLNTNIGKEFKETLCDAYADAGQKVCNTARRINEKSQTFSDKILGHQQKNSDHLNLTIGAIAGGILGISAIIFLTSNSAKGLKEHACHSFECLTDKAHCFEDKARSIADRVEENVVHWTKKIEKLIDALNLKDSNLGKRPINGTHTVDKILDWAVVAAQVFQSLKK